MPNHFHFIMLPNELACSPAPSPQNGIPMQMLSRQIGITLSSYTKAINNQNSSCGNLFQKKTKAKCLSTGSVETPDMNSLGYLLTCFLYIHENPLKAGLVNELKDWEYSSWADYAGLRNSGICDRQKLLDLIGLSMQECIFQNRLMNENAGIGAGIGQAT